jgi:outer membrane protein TolC
MRRSRQAKALSAIALCLLLAGCASWFKKPVVVKPTARAPESFGAPQTANAAGDAVDRAWWTLFQDPVLNGLQAQLETGNLNLQLLSAKVRQAQASVAAAQASLWPSVSVTAGAARSVSGGGAASNSASLSLPLTWELDVWGRIDLQTQAAQANALASQEDLALARLSMPLVSASFVRELVRSRLISATRPDCHGDPLLILNWN